MLNELTITPQNSIYIPIENTQRVYLGISTDHTNILTPSINKNWSLYLDEQLIQSGTVNVRINSFSSYVDITGLIRNRLYYFTIHNENSSDQTAVITTINNPTIVDEFYPFTEQIQIHGSLISYPSQSAPGSPTYVRLPSNWNLRILKTPGYIITSTGTFVFVPSKIITHDRDLGDHVNYMAFPTLPVMNLKVCVLPSIRRMSFSAISVDPPTRLKISIEFFDGVVEEFDTGEVKSVVDLQVTKRHVVRCEPIF
jgi:hypothetical protein